MTKVPKPSSWSASYSLTWDAWDRLVKAVDGANTVGEYEYDGLHRRIRKAVYSGGALDHTEHFYLSEDDQVLEVRFDSDTAPTEQFTWGARYVDDLVFRTRDTDDNGSLDETLYALQDAGWHITALADTAGAVVERFKYDPYGRSTVLDPNFTNDSDGVSDFAWDYRFTTREWDAETGLLYFRARYYHTTLGRFIGRDPLEYVDGSSLYAGYFVPDGLDPFGLSDSSGWRTTCNPFTWPGARLLPWLIAGYEPEPRNTRPVHRSVDADDLPTKKGTWNAGSRGTYRGQSYRAAGQDAADLTVIITERATAGGLESAALGGLFTRGRYVSRTSRAFRQIGRNRFIKNLHAEGFTLVGRTRQGGGLIYRNARTGAEVRIMPRPNRRPFRGEPAAKFQDAYYYRFRRGSDQPWGPHIPLPE